MSDIIDYIINTDSNNSIKEAELSNKDIPACLGYKSKINVGLA